MDGEQDASLWGNGYYLGAKPPDDEVKLSPFLQAAPSDYKPLSEQAATAGIPVPPPARETIDGTEVVSYAPGDEDWDSRVALMGLVSTLSTPRTSTPGWESVDELGDEAWKERQAATAQSWQAILQYKQQQQQQRFAEKQRQDAQQMRLEQIDREAKNRLAQEEYTRQNQLEQYKATAEGAVDHLRYYGRDEDADKLQAEIDDAYAAGNVGKLHGLGSRGAYSRAQTSGDATQDRWKAGQALRIAEKEDAKGNPTQDEYEKAMDTAVKSIGIIDSSLGGNSKRADDLLRSLKAAVENRDWTAIQKITRDAAVAADSANKTVKDTNTGEYIPFPVSQRIVNDYLAWREQRIGKAANDASPAKKETKVSPTAGASGGASAQPSPAANASPSAVLQVLNAKNNDGKTALENALYQLGWIDYTVPGDLELRRRLVKALQQAIDRNDPEAVGAALRDIYHKVVGLKEVGRLAKANNKLAANTIRLPKASSSPAPSVLPGSSGGAKGLLDEARAK